MKMCPYWLFRQNKCSTDCTSKICNGTTVEKEALNVYWAVQNFHVYLYGQKGENNHIAVLLSRCPQDLKDKLLTQIDNLCSASNALLGVVRSKHPQFINDTEEYLKVESIEN